MLFTIKLDALWLQVNIHSSVKNIHLPVQVVSEEDNSKKDPSVLQVFCNNKPALDCLKSLYA